MLAATVTHRLNPWTLVGAHTYLWGRVVYLGLYLGGVPLIRSLFWNVALLGTFIIFAQLL